MLTREATLAEGIEGGFAAVYGVLKVLEERGQVRRGYFVAGLGAAQFALPGAVDRLRALRAGQPDPDAGDAAGHPGRGEITVLAATDPAQPYGAALAWPATTAAGRPARAAGAVVLLAGGEPAAYLEKGGHSLLTFPAATADDHWVDALAALVKDGRVRSLEIRTVDGGPASTSPWGGPLRQAGFVEGYKGLVLRGS